MDALRCCCCGAISGSIKDGTGFEVRAQSLSGLASRGTGILGGIDVVIDEHNISKF